mmetsp:Transcript_14395/g.35714  ORF Transcript_14395/g.35714 Transcript_14395/m.35714 type:complete len:221 (-) Transcript_14395:2508-3170(-)
MHRRQEFGVRCQGNSGSCPRLMTHEPLRTSSVAQSCPVLAHSEQSLGQIHNRLPDPHAVAERPQTQRIQLRLVHGEQHVQLDRLLLKSAKVGLQPELSKQARDVDGRHGKAVRRGRLGEADEQAAAAGEGRGSCREGGRRQVTRAALGARGGIYLLEGERQRAGRAVGLKDAGRRGHQRHRARPDRDALLQRDVAVAVGRAAAAAATTALLLLRAWSGAV